MAKQTAVRTEAQGPGKRQPCPCGSGKRYKACHGAPGGAPVDVHVPRPFAGLSAEPELVALREFVPCATMELPEAAERRMVLGTVLPTAAAAFVRNDDVALIGMQTQTRSGDLSRDLATAIEWAKRAKPGESLAVVPPPTEADTSRLQDLMPAGTELAQQLHEDFSWWLPEGAEPNDEVAASIEQANQAIMPTIALDGLPGAYWVAAGDKAHLRWVRSEPEDQLLGALARLHARGELALGEGSRFAGSFRAHGLLVPVWDLDPEPHAREWESAAASLGERLTAALAELETEPLSGTERRALDGLRGRQITLR